jgi:hypothetical protein
MNFRVIAVTNGSVQETQSICKELGLPVGQGDLTPRNWIEQLVKLVEGRSVPITDIVQSPGVPSHYFALKSLQVTIAFSPASTLGDVVDSRILFARGADLVIASASIIDWAGYVSGTQRSTPMMRQSLSTFVGKLIESVGLGQLLNQARRSVQGQIIFWN